MFMVFLVLNASSDSKPGVHMNVEDILKRIKNDLDVDWDLVASSFITFDACVRGLGLGLGLGKTQKE
jgi:hypothetical protein